VKFNTKVELATWQEEEGVWKLQLVSSDGTRCEDSCEVLVNGSGVLNSWKYPNIPGIKDFKGDLMHSATWDPKIDLKGKTVAVIGGGSSAVQIVPQIQPSELLGQGYDILLADIRNSCRETNTISTFICLDYHGIWRQVRRPRRHQF
jgi:lysine/ornithine N-monooxygenase